MTLPVESNLTGLGIRQKMAIILLAITMISLIVTGSVYHFKSQSSIESIAIAHLKTVANVKKNYVYQTIKKNKERVSLIGSRTQLRISLQAYLNTDNADNRAGIRDRLNQIISDAQESIKSIRKITLVGLKREIIASTSSQTVRANVSQTLLPSSNQKQKVTFYYDEGVSKGALYVSERLFLQDRIVGYVLVELDLSDFAILTDSQHGLGSTEETTVSYKDEDTNKVLPIYPESLTDIENSTVWVNPFALSRQNDDEITTYTDYRGKEVLAVAYTFESLNLGMVYKIDYEDALGMMQEQAQFLFISSLLTIIVAALVVLALSRTITKPIIDLTYVATMIASGDLSRRIKHFTKDELGLLAMAFNQMADKLINANAVLEERVKEKTKELSEANQSLARLNRDLEVLSLKDALTNIANRRAFDNRLEIEWKRCMRDNTSMGIILLDIDYFKNYNDSLGHRAGDDCLQRVAYLLEQCANRDSDLVARYGGEEFIVLLPNTHLDQVRTVAEKFQSKLREAKIPHPSSNVSHCVTVSVGIGSLVPTLSASSEEFINRVDAALYEAKAKGRDAITSI